MCDLSDPGEVCTNDNGCYFREGCMANDTCACLPSNEDCEDDNGDVRNDWCCSGVCSEALGDLCE